MSGMQQSAEYWIEQLGLIEHPEGGYFRETYRSDQFIDNACLPEEYEGRRSFCTSIYFLLTGTQSSHLHRLRSDELWHYHAGGSGTIHIITPEGEYVSRRIGSVLEDGDRLQVVIPAGCWFGVTVNDANSYLLVGCTVAPGFEFDDFELGDRHTLLSSFPRHQGLIERLTISID